MDADLLRRRSGRCVAEGLVPPPVPPVLGAGEEMPPEPRQARSRAKRKEILSATQKLFAERGYHATSIGDITTRAGTASGAFYTYFRSKRQLLIVLMKELVERLARLDLRPKGGSGVHDGVRRFLAEVFKADREYYGVIRAFQEAALTDGGLSSMQNDLESWTQARILLVFRGLQKYPNARSGQDLPGFARLMDRHFWSILARGAQLPRRDFNREVRMAADVIYYYLFTDSAQ
jgi:AcrR family transcriptional regulator